MSAPRFRYSTILFDFDGTLTPSLPLWLRAYQYALEQFGVRLTAEEVITACFYRGWEEIVSDYELSSVEAFTNHVHVGLSEAFEGAVPFEGVANILEDCRGQSIKLGIVTSSTANIVKKFLKEHDMGDYFSSVVTADDIINFKPHPEPVLLALSQLESPAAGSLLIGDSAVDMLAAHAAGIEKGLFFPHEHHVFCDFEQLTTHGPHFVFHTYWELKQKLSHASTG